VAPSDQGIAQGPDCLAAHLDASQMHVHVATQNVYVSGGGTRLHLKLKSSGTTLATRTFNSYLSGNNIYPSNPGAVNNWMTQCPNADHVQARTQVSTSPATSGPANAAATVSGVYAGTTWASSRVAWVEHPQCRHPASRRCPVLQ
jgi:hypothetical protein